MIRVGPAGWSYPDWEGTVYPRAKPRGFHPLRHLAGYFDCLEINSSFYADVRPEHSERWSELLSDRPAFRLTAKLHRDFTHETGREPDEARARAFRRGIAPLVRDGRLAGLLAQFPWSFRRDDAATARVAALLGLFAEVPLVLELRHASWFEPGALADLAARGASLAAIDLPRSATAPPEVFRAVGRLGYLRLHGRNRDAWFDRAASRDSKYDYLYGAEEIRELSARARRLSGEHDETYVVTNNHFSGKAIANALEIQAELSGAPVRVPPELLASFPRLQRIARPEGQGRLFDGA